MVLCFFNQHSGDVTKIGMGAQVNLLKSKLILPGIDSNTIERRALFETFDTVSNYSTIFVSAPAGAGKTTSISRWINNNDIDCAWISLDENDNNPTRFMQYFCTSIELQIDTPFSSVLETQDYQGMLDRLLIVLQNIDHPLLIVVDDFHYITNQAVYNLLVYFLRYKTNNIQVVFSGRSSLPLSFEPLLLNHKIVLVDEDALRFSADEIKEFLSKKNFLVNDDQVKLLSRKTDGWALALVALSLTMNKVVDTAQIHNLKGARYIENFLLQEVWAKWDENTRKFLMLTSVLDEFSLPLAVEMTGMEHSRDILKKLQDHQAFIVTLDHDETLYRYHHVFRDFLATMLSRDEQFSAQKQNRLAANYYRKSKNTSKAVPYYLKANDFDGLMALIEENCSDFLLSDEAEKTGCAHREPRAVWCV